jgi:hypothetical protein
MPENTRRLRSLTIAGCAAIFSPNVFTEVANQLRTRLGEERRIWSRPTWYQPRTSPRRLNAIIDFLQAPVVYLEIGLNRGKTFESVRAEVRDAVDPFPKIQLEHLPGNCRVFSETSDVFFERDLGHKSYDLVFIDGLHTWQQTHKDILNTFSRSPKAILLIDDVVPSDATSAVPDFDKSLTIRSLRNDSSNEWCGDVFKSIEAITKTQPNIRVLTLISPGYPQTLMWLDIPQDGVKPEFPLENSLDNLLEFEEVFVNGIPRYFQPMADTEALEIIRKVIGSRD